MGFARPAEVCVVVEKAAMLYHVRGLLINQSNDFFKHCRYMGTKELCLVEWMGMPNGARVVDYFGRVVY